MANRYLRATGNWNGPVWADTSGGAAGSAATPTANDWVYIFGNTVTLTQDAVSGILKHHHGTINLNGHKLTTDGYYNDAPVTSPVLNMGSGTLELTATSGSKIRLSPSLTLNEGDSLVKLLPPSGVTSINLGSHTFNDLAMYIGTGSSSATVNVTGSPTFRSLVIQSKNSAAHTVNFDNTATITTDRFVAIGSSSGSKLTLDGQFDAVNMGMLTINDSSYGQFVKAQISTNGDAPKYIGSNSEMTFGWEGWLLQDPPKISTLVDPLTTAPGSNSNWTVSGTVTQVTDGHSGGGYAVSGSSPI